MMGIGNQEILLLLVPLWYVLTSLSLVPAVAHYKGRSGLAWTLTALLYSPLLALIALAAVPDIEPEDK